MKMNDPGSIYNDGTYYKNNNLWHAEDSSWKGKKILEILLKNNLSLNKITIDFEICDSIKAILSRIDFLKIMNCLAILRSIINN